MDLVIEVLPTRNDGNDHHLLDPPDGITKDICSGSIITNKHILTSAECLLKNEANDKEGYNDHTNINVQLGDANRGKSTFEAIAPNGIIPHPEAFSHGYIYNIGTIFVCKAYL